MQQIGIKSVAKSCCGVEFTLTGKKEEEEDGQNAIFGTARFSM